MGVILYRIRIKDRVLSLTAWCDIYDIRRDNIYRAIHRYNRTADEALYSALLRKGYSIDRSDVQIIQDAESEEAIKQRLLEKKKPKKKEMHLYRWYDPLTSHSGIYRERMLTEDQAEAIKEYARGVREVNV